MQAAVDQKRRINLLRLSLLAMMPAILAVNPALGLDGLGHEVIEAFGLLLLLTGVLGRFWSILYVGGASSRMVVQDGPYLMTRNPLYFLSTVAATGMGLMFRAGQPGAADRGAVGVILWITARKEAAFLSHGFGADHDAYAARTPFFLPDPRLFRTDTIVQDRYRYAAAQHVRCLCLPVLHSDHRAGGPAQGRPWLGRAAAVVRMGLPSAAAAS